MTKCTRHWRYLPVNLLFERPVKRPALDAVHGSMKLLSTCVLPYLGAQVSLGEKPSSTILYPLNSTVSLVYHETCTARCPLRDTGCLN